VHGVSRGPIEHASPGILPLPGRGPFRASARGLRQQPCDREGEEAAAEADGLRSVVGQDRRDAPRGAVGKDAHGTVLADGDAIVLIKDLPLRGASQVLKGGTKAKGIRLVEGDHEISCKIEGSAIALKACYVRKA
jgi:protein PhnA